MLFLWCRGKRYAENVSETARGMPMLQKTGPPPVHSQTVDLFCFTRKYTGILQPGRM
jgi:hypothetical protein